MLAGGEVGHLLLVYVSLRLRLGALPHRNQVLIPVLPILIFPSRNVAVGLCTVIAKGGGIMAPYISILVGSLDINM